MRNPESRQAAPLLRDVLSFQLKLVLDALRDVVLSPLALAATVLDLLLLRRQAPRYFHATLMLGKRSEEWIDLWSAVEERDGVTPENVDALLARVEQVVRDPRAGKHKARVLMRWAELNLAKQRRKSSAALATGQSPPPPPPPSSPA